MVKYNFNQNKAFSLTIFLNLIGAKSYRIVLTFNNGGKRKKLLPNLALKKFWTGV